MIEGGMCGRWTTALAAVFLGTVFWGVGAVVVSLVSWWDIRGAKADTQDRDSCMCGGTGERMGEYAVWKGLMITD